MPREGQQGQTAEQRAAATQLLDKKIAAMLDELRTRPKNKQGPYIKRNSNYMFLTTLLIKNITDLQLIYT